MATHYQTHGFVFKKSDRNEADRIFSIFTYDFGRLEIFAKAIRKIDAKLRGGIDTLYWSDIEFIQGKHNKTLIDARIIKKPQEIFSNPKALILATKITGVLDEIIKGAEKEESLFLLLQEVLGFLSNTEMSPKTYEIIYHYFIWNLFVCQGKMPDLYHCISCKEKLTPNSLRFSFANGGILCEKCKQVDMYATTISADVVKLLRILLKRDWQIISKITMQESVMNSLRLLSDMGVAQLHA